MGAPALHAGQDRVPPLRLKLAAVDAERENSLARTMRLVDEHQKGPLVRQFLLIWSPAR